MRRLGPLVGWVLGAIAFKLITGCVTAEDYKDPAVGGTGLAAVEMCRENLSLSCGWVYDFRAGEIELCLPWEDRSPIYKLRETAESLYGDSELARDIRFHGVPLCYWQCPSAKGCNAANGCYCLDEVPQ